MKWTGVIVLAVFGLACDGSSRAEMDAGVSGTIPDAGEAANDGGGWDVPIQETFCVSRDARSTCFGEQSRAFVVQGDGGIRDVVLLGSGGPYGARLAFAAQFPSTSETTVVGELEWTERACSEPTCPVTCRYGIADAGVRLSRFDETVLEATSVTPPLMPSINADGGCPAPSLKVELRLATP